jgi:hypothetical protein
MQVTGYCLFSTTATLSSTTALPSPPFPSTATDPANDAERANAEEPSDADAGTYASDPAFAGVIYYVGALAKADALHDPSTPQCQFQAKPTLVATPALSDTARSPFTPVFSVTPANSAPW